MKLKGMWTNIAFYNYMCLYIYAYIMYNYTNLKKREIYYREKSKENHRWIDIKVFTQCRKVLDYIGSC